MGIIKKGTDNLFGALFTYCPRPEREPLEDFCTEALGWCLRNSTGFRERILRLAGLEALPNGLGTIEVETQCISEGTGRFDLLIKSQSDAPFVMLVESKVVRCSMDAQLARYRQYVDRDYAHLPRARRLLVSLTALPTAHPDVDVHLHWENIQKLLATTEDPCPFVNKVLKEFAAFLDTKGLAPITMPKISPTLLASWHEAKRLEHALAKILEKLRTDPAINKITSCQQVNRADKNWIGISGQNCFWAGFCIKGQEMYMWVEITLPGDKRSLRQQLKPPLVNSFRNATKYLADWKDNDAVNRDAGDSKQLLQSRFVFAQSVNKDLEPDSDGLFNWLYDTSLAVIGLATPRRSSKRG